MPAHPTHPTHPTQLYKAIRPFDVRKAESARMRAKYPDRVPVIVERAPNNESIPHIDNTKYLVPYDLTVCQFVFVLRKRLQLPPERAMFLFIDNKLPPNSALMSVIYEEMRDPDGFLYLRYAGENTFGADDDDDRGLLIRGAFDRLWCARQVERLDALLGPSEDSSEDEESSEDDLDLYDRARVKDDALVRDVTAVLRAPEHADALARVFPQAAHASGYHLHHQWFLTRYPQGGNLRPHVDGSVGESFATVLIYLNDDFEGGETVFLDPNRVCRPETGALLVLRQDAWHRGNTVRRGVKYLIRGDVCRSAAASST
jgi:GABA(A) receptor-associated protein